MSQQNVPWFLGQTGPANYVAGLGRGATGFTTRSDIGPARQQVPEAMLLGQKRERDESEQASQEDNERVARGGSNLEGERLFAGDPYDKEDEEADSVWAAIEEKMDSRRRQQREAREREELEKFRAVRPKIQQSFADLTSKLKDVSEEEWANIPEVGDRRLRYQKREETFTPVPDNIIESARSHSQYSAQVDVREQQFAGIATPLNAATPVADLTQMGKAKKTILSMQLNSKADSVSGQTVADPKGYLTDLKSMQVGGDVDISDVKRARELLQSALRTNPSHGPAWICAARIEECAGKLGHARKLIKSGCEKAGDHEDVWLEAARLHNPETAKVILAKAVSKLPKSVKIWMHAVDLEKENSAKKAILRRALMLIPNSEELWKSAVELEAPEDARILLARAVECIPDRVDLWLALARLETYDKAKVVLNTAIKKIPTEPTIWINAAMLEEANGKDARCATIIKRAIKALGNRQVVLSREAWLKEAEAAEAAEAPVTCRTIVQETIGVGVEEEDQKAIWMEDAQACISHGSIQTARSIYAHALSKFPQKKSIWLKNAMLEKMHGTPESLQQLIEEAVKHCPHSETLWLMGAKELWLQGDVDGGRGMLERAFKENPNSEEIWLAAVKIESENNQFSRARALLVKAREQAGTKRVWLKSAQLERSQGNVEAEKKILEEGIHKFPTFDKFYLMLGQLAERIADPSARAIYREGTVRCVKSATVWIWAARYEEKTSAAKARSLLEKARVKNPKNDLLWLESVRVEIRDGQQNKADTMISKALQECPKSGILWAEAIAMEKRAKRKSKVLVALRECDDDPHIMVAVAKVFWDERKLAKARSWFKRAIAMDEDLGDAWAAYYKFEVQHGKEQQQRAVVDKCKAAEPRHGEKWQAVSKAVENSGLTTEEILKKVSLII